MTIWKYELPLEDIFAIGMPKDAKILCVQISLVTDKPVMYALVDPENEFEQREFIMRGAGHLIEDASKYQYIGTFQMKNGILVFHVFEILHSMLEDISDCDDLYEMTLFKAYCKEEMFKDSDGFANPIVNNKIDTSIWIKPSDILQGKYTEYSKVVWFNK